MIAIYNKPKTFYREISGKKIMLVIILCCGVYTVFVIVVAISFILLPLGCNLARLMFASSILTLLFSGIHGIDIKLGL